MELRTIHGIACLAITATLASANLHDDCGWTALASRIGTANVPTGADVIVGQVEATDGSGNYTPDGDNTEFDGKFMIRRSGGASGPSSHATMVGRRIYGLDSSIATGIWFINCYEVNHWLQAGFLNVGAGGSVEPEPILGAQKIWNHSWVGSSNNLAWDTDALRRLDWTIERDDSLVSVGVNNGQSSQPLLAYAFNVLAVGRHDGDHAATTVPSGYDGEGRRRPDISAPLDTTSECTGIVSGAAAMLVELIRDGGLGIDAGGESSEVLRATLLASASHTGTSGDGESWSNDAPASGVDRGFTTTPLDAIVGAGHLNVDRAHAIMSGNRQAGSHAIETPADAIEHGWSLESMSAGQTRAWQFRSLSETDELSILATWNRQVSSNFASWTLADLDLELHRAEGGELIDLTGDAGIEIFESGNVRSNSSVDNLEHLYISNLEAGHYVLRLTRNDAGSDSVDVGIAWFASTPVISGDLNDSGLVDVLDLLLLLMDWGCSDCEADLDGSGAADESDLMLLLERWGS